MHELTRSGRWARDGDRCATATRSDPLKKEITTIGRSNENDICFPDAAISRLHLTIVRQGDQFFATDKSTNGTFVNQKRIFSCELKANDTIRLGGWTIVFGPTKEIEERTTQLAVELDPDLANFMLATPYPGTEMYELIRRHGNIYAHEWQDYAIHSDKARFSMPDYDPDLVVRKWKEAYRRFYLYRPKRVWQKVSKKSFWTELPHTVANARRFFMPAQERVAEEPVART